MSNDKLAEALRELVHACEEHNAMVSRIIGHPAGWNAQYLDSARVALQAHAAEAAQAQAQSDDMVTFVHRVLEHFPLDAEGCFLPLSAHRLAFAIEKSRAAAPQQAAEPVGYVSADILKTFRNGDLSSIRLWRSSDDFVGPVVEVYTHPQPAKDAALYQELLMAVSKKFPNESRHETALRYIKQTELQSCEPKCDAAMAKESGR